MTFISVAQANSRTAEFARLFDLFDRVATRRARALTGDTSEVISADDIAHVPVEFAPVLKNLSTVLSMRARHNGEHAGRAQSASMASSKQRHHSNTAGVPSAILTVEHQMPPTVVMEPPKEAEEDTENPSFPPGQRYPFTFKLMLHKLYDLDEWAEKVKNAVETSKSQFKPLAERIHGVAEDNLVNSKGRGEKRGRSSVQPGHVLGVSAKFKPPSTTNVKERGEKRSNVRPILGTSAKFKPPSTTRQIHSVATHVKPEASRVVKKRCVGRRKSIDGPISTGVWVYNAVISAVEVAGPRRAVEITLSAPRGHGAGGVVDDRARHRSLTELENMRTRDASRRKIKITVPLLQEEGAESSPRQSVTEPEKVAKKRKSVIPSFASESRKRATVKRPLCV